MQLTWKMDDCDKLKGTKLDETHYDILIEDPIRVLKPDGSLLCHIVRGCSDGTPYKIFIDKVKGLLDNRGTSTGKGNLVGQHNATKNPIKAGYNSGTTRVAKSAFQVLSGGSIPMDSSNRGVSSGKNTHRQRVLSDGRLTNTRKTVNPEGVVISSNSGIIGYFDRYPRFPYARETSFLIKHKKEWQALQPFINSVNDVFKEHASDRYAIQKDLANRCSSDWIIGNTAFSTITVNKSYRTACHKDAGDLSEGFGVMAYFQTGKLSGGYLVLPAYRIALALQHGDVVLFDVHEWHGNTPIVPLGGKAERITCVFYLREKLLRCGDAKYEIQRAKQVRKIGKLYDADEIQKAELHKKEVLAKHGISYPYPKQTQTKKQTIRSAKK